MSPLPSEYVSADQASITFLSSPLPHSFHSPFRVVLFLLALTQNDGSFRAESEKQTIRVDAAR